MKKVAIVSCYFQKNYGSALQALATQMALDKLGVDNETIDISGFNNELKRAKIRYFIKAALTSDILIHKFGMAKNLVIKKFSKNEYAVSCQKRNKMFEEFVKNNFRLSEVYASKEELSQKCSENYSAVLVGSDQLWLPANIAADYYTLNFAPENINSIAYSTSFGMSVLPKNIENKARIFLKKIKHIGVREQTGQHMIKKLTDRNVPIVCDPTLLFTGEEWLNMQKEEAIIKEPYILCYFLGNNPPHRDFAKRLRDKTGHKIVALLHLDEFVKCDENYADITPYDIGPAEFLNLIRNAEYVCTDSFHCTVFSILYRKDFFTFRRYAGKTKQSTNSRLDTLFSLTSIDTGLIRENEDISALINKKIDYNKVHKRIDSLRQESLKYLKTALEDRESTDL